MGTITKLFICQSDFLMTRCIIDDNNVKHQPRFMDLYKSMLEKVPERYPAKVSSENLDIGSALFDKIPGKVSIDSSVLLKQDYISYNIFEYPYIEVDVSLLNGIPIENLISFSHMLFGLSFLGLLFNIQKTVVVFMLFVELMLYSLSFLTIVFSLKHGYPQGQIFALLILGVAVAESAIGLGILIAVFRKNQRIELDNFSFLRG